MQMRRCTLNTPRVANRVSKVAMQQYLASVNPGR